LRIFNGACSASRCPSAEGIIRAASELVPHSSPLDVVPWDLDSPEIMQILGEFSEKILNGEQQLPEFEQLNAVTEAVIAQVVAPAKTAGTGGEDAGLMKPVGGVNNGSQNSTSANNLLNSSSFGRIDAPQKTQTMLTLPLNEPDTLALPQISYESDRGCISPVPDAATFNDIQIVKEAMITSDDSKYFDEVNDLYDPWNSSTIDTELFPELF